ncbi:MAG TPA: Flp family type IVb pilin [Xanthobacteraceae bacterium]|jgi:pilus assembly protein Flp/PilA|nr:Flp family type IVb pilin [Xanthobacteraceae bacterium]
MTRMPEGNTAMNTCLDNKIAPPVSRFLSRFLRDESGATAIEYALIASGVAVAIAASVTSLGTSVKTLFTSVSTAMK